MRNVLKSLSVGIHRRWKLGVAAAFAFLGAMWTITEIAELVFSGTKALLEANGSAYLEVAVAGFLAAFLARVYEPRQITFCVPTTTTKVTLKFCDLFAEDADIVVPVNEYVDSQIGSRVASASIHGQLIQKWFNSEAAFRSAADAELAAHSATITNRDPGPNALYSLGTTFRVSAGPRQAYVLVFAHSNAQTDKAFVDLSEAIAAVRALLLFVYQHGSGRAVAIPLIGNGQSGLNLKPQHLLRLWVLLIVAVAREKGLPKDVRVCLHDDCFEELDLREIVRDWRQ